MAVEDAVRRQEPAAAPAAPAAPARRLGRPTHRCIRHDIHFTPIISADSGPMSDRGSELESEKQKAQLNHPSPGDKVQLCLRLAGPFVLLEKAVCNLIADLPSELSEAAGKALEKFRRPIWSFAVFRGMNSRPGESGHGLAGPRADGTACEPRRRCGCPGRAASESARRPARRLLQVMGFAKTPITRE